MVGRGGVTLGGVFLFKRIELYRKGIRRIDDVWDSNRKDFITWEAAQHKFNLTTGESQEWANLTNTISEVWRRKLEEDSDTGYPRMWLGMYVKGKKTPRLWLGAVRNLPLVLTFLSRPRVIPWELTLDILENGSTQLESLKDISTRLRSCSPIEALRKKGRKKESRLYFLRQSCLFSLGPESMAMGRRR